MEGITDRLYLRARSGTTGVYCNYPDPLPDSDDVRFWIINIKSGEIIRGPMKDLPFTLDNAFSWCNPDGSLIKKRMEIQ